LLKTLAYDATALLTAAFKGVHLIIQQQLLDFLGSLYGKARHIVMQQREIMLLTGEL
jgi:hypothetical protein